MSENYISQFYTWATGNTITAPRLNGNVSNVTDGLSSGVKAVNIGKLLIGGTETINSSRNGIFNGITLSSDVTTISYAIDWDLIDNTASALSFDASGKTGLLEFDTTDGAEGLKSSGFLRLGSDASALTDVGAFVLGASNDSGLFFNGTDLVIQTDGAGASGIIFDSEDDTFEFKGSGTLQATFDTTGLNLVSGDVFKINGTSVLSNDTLGSGVVNTSITSTGALNSGSITSGFGNIDVGSSNIDGGTITADTALVGTLSTASQPNISSVGTLSTLTVSGDATFDTSLFFIDTTNGRVGLGTASPTPTNTLYDDGILHIHQPNTGSRGSQIHLTNESIGSTSSDGCHIASYSTEMYIVNQEAGPIRLHTNNIERMRIDSSGSVLINTTDTDPTNDTSGNGTVISSTGWFASTASGQTVAYFNRTDSSGGTVLDFRLNGVNKGSISVASGGTTYGTISDYRLKENVTPIIDGISRLMQLKPSRFNFLENKNEIVDGFLAHEVQEIIPESVTGQKDAVDEQGKPEYQAIDQSKIVPLLVASVQELAKKVEILENK
jgi:hypothetical protein